VSRHPDERVLHNLRIDRTIRAQRMASKRTLDEGGVERAIERLREHVRARGLKRSTVREAVARVALRRGGHFSVDELLGDLRAQGMRDAHPATLYRVLPLLVDVGLLQLTLVSRGDGARYERAFEREHHDHLICTRCGKVVEFHFEAIEVLQRDVAARYGFRLSGHVHELLGECRECRRAAEP
jgi:Fur family ferric uptake transcriptional regulator